MTYPSDSCHHAADQKTASVDAASPFFQAALAASAYHPDTLLRRNAAASALTAAGFVTSRATLATLATRGGGPPYRRYGRVPLYRWGDLLDWAKGRLGPPAASTSAHRMQAT